MKTTELPETFAVVVELAIDENGGSTVSATGATIGDRGFDLGVVFVGANVLLELFDIKAKTLSVPRQGTEVERLLIGEERVVHRPESALFVGSVSGAGGHNGVRVDVAEGKGAKDVQHVGALFGL